MKTLAKCLRLLVSTACLFVYMGLSSFAKDNVTIYDTAPLVREVYMSADGEMLILVYDTHLEAWDVSRADKVAETIEPLFVDIPLAYSTTGQRIAWTVNGQYAAVTNSEINTISVYERGNDIPLYTIVDDENTDFLVEGVLWRADGAVWVPVGQNHHNIEFYNAENGAVVGKITLDTERYLYQVSFYGLQFGPDASDLAAGVYSAGTSDIRVYDTNTLEERIVVEEHATGPFPISFHWLTPSTLQYCIDPSVDGPEGSLEAESITHNLETGQMTHIPVCIGDVSPDGEYGLRMNIEAEIEVIELLTGKVVDVLALTDFADVDPLTLWEVTRYKWEVGGIIIYRSISPIIWRPELPDDEK